MKHGRRLLYLASLPAVEPSRVHRTVGPRLMQRGGRRAGCEITHTGGPTNFHSAASCEMVDTFTARPLRGFEEKRWVADESAENPIRVSRMSQSTAGARGSGSPHVYS